MWCIVIEHGSDGTVDVNGPYDTQDAASAAVETIAVAMADESGETATVRPGHDTTTATVGEVDSGDETWIYVRRMGTPVRGQS